MLSVDNVHKSYPGPPPHPVLDAVSLTLHPGESLALVGPSGAGKSTLLHLLAGLERADHGQISLDNHRYNSLDENAMTQLRRAQIGVVYQFFNLLPTLSAKENLALPLTLNNWPDEQIDERVDELLHTLELRHRACAFPEQLSGGEQQRIAVGRALAARPALVLADEPTGNLDGQRGAQVLKLLFELSEQERQSLIVVTHSRRVAERAARCLALIDGKPAPPERVELW